MRIPERTTVGNSSDKPIIYFIEDIKNIIDEKEDEILVDAPAKDDHSPTAQIANYKLDALHFLWHHLHKLNAAPRYDVDTALKPVFSPGRSPDETSYWFCPSCGFRIGKEKIVLRHKQSDGDSFCANCGVRIDWKSTEGTEGVD